LKKFAHIGCYVSSINFFLLKKKIEIVKKKFFFRKIGCYLILIKLDGILVELLEPTKNSFLYKIKDHNKIDHIAFYCKSLKEEELKFVNLGARIVVKRTFSPFFKKNFLFLSFNGILIELIEK
jgi:hypothetical protein